MKITVDNLMNNGYELRFSPTQCFTKRSTANNRKIRVEVSKPFFTNKDDWTLQIFDEQGYKLVRCRVQTFKEIAYYVDLVTK